MNEQLVTIGIACFNAQDTIVRAIQSGIDQSWQNKEILVVDDASTDNSALLVSEFVNNIQNIRFIRHATNKGPAGVRQTILDSARGDFIVFFDDDDESLPKRIATQVNHICEYEQTTGTSLVACYASGRREYSNGYHLTLKAIGSEHVVPHGQDVADRLLFYGGHKDFFYGTGTPTCSLMARSSVFSHVGGFDQSFRRVEDVDFAVRLSLAGGHFIGCHEELFIQYATEAQDKSPEKNLVAEIQLAEKFKVYLDSRGYYIHARTWPKLRYYHFKKNYFLFLTTLLYLIYENPFKTVSHFFKTAPRRLWHETKIYQKKQR